MEDGENGREMKKREERSYKLSQLLYFILVLKQQYYLSHS
jgi:hypothetical protein